MSRNSKITTVLLRLTFGFALLAPHAAGAAPDCAALEELQVADTRITKVSAHEAKDPDAAAVSRCQAEGVIGEEIGFVIVLPEKANWNGKFFMAGVGGFAGSYDFRGLIPALNEGYAAVMTNTGHTASGVRADWAHNDLERLVNYGYLGVHRTAVTAKAIVREFYGGAPEYSYFSGCSNGGRQAMMEAQRYPEDFDGIIAGAPAHDFTGIMAAFVYNSQRIFPDPDDVRSPIITPDNRKLLQSTILEQCDADDGVEDGILDDPRLCGFEVSSLPLCADDKPAPHCLTVAQREAIEAVYGGPRSQGGPIFRGLPFGAENEPTGWEGWITGPNKNMLEAYNEPSLQFAFGTQGFKYLFLGDPNWDYSDYDLSSFEQDVERIRSTVDAVDPDLSGLKAAGGKMILWHGWSDAALTALASIDYYEAARSLDPGVSEYLRFYLLPGVHHCVGGPGPDRVDWLQALENWVERDQAPGALTASRIRDGEETMTRPVCVYPERAVYQGSGDVNDASNFRCQLPE